MTAPHTGWLPTWTHYGSIQPVSGCLPSLHSGSVDAAFDAFELFFSSPSFSCLSSLPHWEESPKTYSEQQTRILAKYKYQNISTSKHLYGGWTNYISLSKYQCNCLSSLVDVMIFCQDCETFACYTYPGKKTRRNACLADLDSIFLCGYLVFSYVFLLIS